MTRAGKDLCQSFCRKKQNADPEKGSAERAQCAFYFSAASNAAFAVARSASERMVYIT